MSCGYCQSVVCDPCPVCNTNLTMTPRPIRKAKGQKSPHVARYSPPVPPPVVNAYTPDNRVSQATWEARNAEATARARNTPPRPPIAPQSGGFQHDPMLSRMRAQQIEENNRKSAALQAALGAAKAAPRPVPVQSYPKAPRATAPTPRLGVFTAVTNADWEAAARFTRAVLRKPLQIESTCRVVDAPTMGPVARGDWAGLARAVELGMLTEAAAIDLAQGWRAS